MSNATKIKPEKAALAGKLVSPIEAVNKIPSGTRIFIGSGAAAPMTLVNALAEVNAGPDNAEVVQIMTLGDDPTAAPELAARYRHNALFIGANVRGAVQQGRADYTPVHLHEIPDLFRPGGTLPLDVAIISVSPPDSAGFVSLGVSVDVVKAAVENAKLVIAEINSNMPRTHGESFVHLSKIKWAVEVNNAIPELLAEEPGEVEKRIGKFVAEFIEDGDTLQLGIGKIPDAVLASLHNKQGLGVHTEMLSDGVVDLVKRGVIDCSQKSIHKGKIVASFAMGSKNLYEFIHDNPMCEFRGSDYVNDPVVIARNNGIVCVNSALQVDLTGQVCSDSRGTQFYSGVGGQVDFIRGASMAKNGKPIIAMPSTAKGGTVSRIVPTLAEGAGVVTSRADVHYVVTEWGIASLHGKTVRERAMELIHVAHPSFREELFEAIKDRAYIYRDQPKAPTIATYPEERERTIYLKSGEEVRLRPLRATDEPLLRDMFQRCSPITVHRRFLATVRSIGHADLKEFLDVDYVTKYAQVAMIGKPGHGKMIGLAQYSLNPDNGKADVAFTVEDDWQHRGIGSSLLQDLLDAARANGIDGFSAQVQFENAPMLKVFHRCGCEVQSKMEDGNYTLSIPFE